MRILLASDHAGYRMKVHLAAFLEKHGHEVLDKGTHDETPSDYPDAARDLGDALLAGEAPRGLLICGSGVGASVAANKIPGVRAGLCHDTYSAHQGVEHDDTNVLVLGARIIGTALAEELVTAFLAAEFSGEERHMRRIAKIAALEERARNGHAG